MAHPIYGPKPIDPAGVPEGKRTERIKDSGGPSFQQILDGKLKTELKFSAHALQRLNARNIEVSPENLVKLEGAIEKAASKGARDSLVLMDNLALVVSIKNRTVITAVDESSLKENVFTNIDSAIIV